MLLAGGCLSPSLFICHDASADAVLLKNGKEVKGVVVERHNDRIILSTERGEIQILLSGIKKIRYDDMEFNFYQVGKAYEDESKYGEALAYYEKALEINPNFEEARQAALGVRNRFWAMTVEGPRSEVERKQVLYDAWDQGKPIEERVKDVTAENARLLKENLGMTLEKKEDWIRVQSLDSKKAAALAGVKRGDRLFSIDGASLRYLGPELVTKRFLVPRYSNFTLEISRICRLHKGEGQKVKALGLQLTQEYKGLVVKSLRAGSEAEACGLKEGDVLTAVDGQPTRYMPIKKAIEIIDRSQSEQVELTIQRPVLLARR